MRTMRDNLKFMEEMARMATGTMGSFTEIRGQIKKIVKERLDDVMSDLDMVSRAEFERVEAVAIKARERQEQLEKRVASLEKQLKTSTKKKAKK